MLYRMCVRACAQLRYVLNCGGVRHARYKRLAAVHMLVVTYREKGAKSPPAVKQNAFTEVDSVCSDSTALRARYANA